MANFIHLKKFKNKSYKNVTKDIKNLTTRLITLFKILKHFLYLEKLKHIFSFPATGAT